MAANSGKRLNTAATARLKQDYIRLKKDPVPYITAEPLHSNILQWHYVAKGPEDSPYHGGYYHGKLVFPKEFPFKPPSIYMITPNGRFKVDSKLCLSMSDFHPDTWNPVWSVATILTGLLSFMLEKGATTGSIETTDDVKHQLAAQSGAFNLKDKLFRELFPDIVKEIEENIRKKQQAELSSESPATENQRKQEKCPDGACTEQSQLCKESTSAEQGHCKDSASKEQGHCRDSTSAEQEKCTDSAMLDRWRDK